jgi:membrane fusion protein (multidrug efflux system)
VRAEAQTVKDGILIPQRCVMELQGLHNVYVVDASNKAETREVKVGPKVGSSWMITEGLKPGERVVYEGLQKVRDGATVNPKVVDATSQSTDQKKSE